MLKLGNYQLLSGFILDDEAKPAGGTGHCGCAAQSPTSLATVAEFGF
jgi:hypothetical protein